MGVFRLVLRGSGWAAPFHKNKQTKIIRKQKVILTHQKIWHAPEHGNVPSDSMQC
jgi:hypothetical protein